jgi:RNA polymerase sigma-70 factor, ECF subfamily
MVDEAEGLLANASRLNRAGRFQFEAAIQSAHAVRRLGREPDWDAIVELYDALLRLTGSPIVALNRAVALGRICGPKTGLNALHAIADKRLSTYQPYWAARADLLARNGDIEEAVAAYEHAAGLTIDPAVRDYLASYAGLLRKQRVITSGQTVR